MTAAADLGQAAEAYAVTTGLAAPATKHAADPTALEAAAVAYAKAEGYAPPPPPGRVLYDTRAELLTELSCTGLPPNVVKVQKPTTVWDGLNFLNNNITLQPDPRYGQVYRCVIKIGDTNPQGGSNKFDGAGQLAKRRLEDIGKTKWFAVAVKIDTWNKLSDLRFCELGSFGYQTSAGSQVAGGVMNRNGVLNWSVDQNAGHADNSTGWAAGTVAYTTGFQPVTFGKWTELVYGVHASTGSDGWVEVHGRVPGVSGWSQWFRHDGATELWGVTPAGTFPQNPPPDTTVIDKLGMYWGNYSNAVYSQTVYETGIVACSDLATAQASFPA